MKSKPKSKSTSKSKPKSNTYHAKPAPARPQPLRVAAFAVVSIVVLGVAGYLLYTAFVRPPLPAVAGKVIDIAASMSGFDQTEVRVKVGEPVTLRLSSLDNSHHTDGGGQHQWAVDELGLDVVAQPLGNNSITFTPTAPGEYQFYCGICCGGRANPSMQGTLIVEA